MMSRKNRGHRQKKKSVLSQVIYYLVIVALVVGIIGIIVVNRQQRAKRAEYKQTLISQETEVDISDLGDMMVRPSAETETRNRNNKSKNESFKDTESNRKNIRGNNRSTVISYGTRE